LLLFSLLLYVKFVSEFGASDVRVFYDIAKEYISQTDRYALHWLQMFIFTAPVYLSLICIHLYSP